MSKSKSKSSKARDKSQNYGMDDGGARQYTPLEMFTELESEVHGLGQRFDAFAAETGEKFSTLNRSNAELRHGQQQQTELLIELKNRSGGLDLSALMEIGGGGLKTAMALFVIGSTLIAGVLWLSTAISTQESHRVNKEGMIRHYEQALEMKDLENRVAVIEATQND